MERDQQSIVEDISRAIVDNERVVLFTGAGISTESGLPDYRGPNGLWTTGNIPRAENVSYDDESRLAWWQERRRRFPFMQSREPNEGHLAIADLGSCGHILAVITQNIDGLHQRAGTDPGRVVELHGSSHELRCLDCGQVMTGDEIQRRLESGDPDPRCDNCGGPLRDGTILFGEALPQRALQLASQVSMLADVMIVVGSSLVVNPAARLPRITHERGGKLIVINRDPTPVDDIADIVSHSEAGPTLSAIAKRVAELQSESEQESTDD